MSDPVTDPIHYAGDGEVSAMRAMRSMMSNVPKLSPMIVYWWGCAFKYLWRWPIKNGKQDVAKCIRCLEYMKAELEGEKHGGEDSA